jgi:hypothetical protein
MPKPDNVRCETCCYWESKDGSQSEGFCRRRAVVPISIPPVALTQIISESAPEVAADGSWYVASYDGVWDTSFNFAHRPVTFDEGWCGEWAGEWPGAHDA